VGSSISLGRWVLAIGTLALGGVLLDSIRSPRTSALRREVLATGHRDADPDARLRSAVLLQRSDCSGNLRLFELLHRGDIRERLRLGVIWYAGSPADSTDIRTLLPRWTANTPLRPVPRPVLAELASLGHRSTPLVVLFDQEGRVRLTSQSPRSPREFAGLRRALEGLTWIEEL
jgi:hypothetical protein